MPYQVDFNTRPTPFGLIQVEGNVKGDVRMKLNIRLNIIKHVVKGFTKFKKHT
jgi:hypothetical protein